MELLVHDLPETPAAWETMPERTILSPQKPIHRCVGCFGCWVKTPGCCVIPDAYQDLGPVLGHCDHLILISRCVYGTFSPFVKNVIDRSLAYMHPYFSVRNAQMHHQRRYQNEMRLSVYFYGDCTPEEMATARCTVTAIATNLDLHQFGIQFVQDTETWEVIL